MNNGFNLIDLAIKATQSLGKLNPAQLTTVGFGIFCATMWKLNDSSIDVIDTSYTENLTASNDEMIDTTVK